MALFRNLIIPEESLRGQLRNQTFPTKAVVVQPSQARANPAELWQALDNRIRPALTYTVTVPLDQDLVFEAPMVFTRRTRLFGQDLDEPAAEGIQIMGQVRDKSNTERGIPGITVLLRETGAEFITNADGQFAFKTREGAITLIATAPTGEQATRQVDVPALEYDLEL